MTLALTCPANGKPCAQTSCLFGCWFEKAPAEEAFGFTLLVTEHAQPMPNEAEG